MNRPPTATNDSARAAATDQAQGTAAKSNPTTTARAEALERFRRAKITWISCNETHGVLARLVAARAESER